MSVNGAVVLEEAVGQLRAVWEETSFQLDRLQAEPRCVAEEEQGLRERTGPSYCLPPTFPTAPVPREPGEGPCAVWASPTLSLGAATQGLDAGACPGKGVRWLGAGFVVGKEPSGPETLPLPQVVPCPALPSCERRAVMETARWQMPSTWPGLR